ncbi:type III-A CRISPR-associated protein Cas10/Csm1 [Bullifex porci]|nr:type III-A CRISPR-associated protein Cas10/Csm1 [Bullifex porci]
MISIKEQYELLFTTLFRDIGIFKRLAFVTEETTIENYSDYSYSFIKEDFIPNLANSPMREYLDWEKIAEDGLNPTSYNYNIIKEASKIVMGGLDVIENNKPTTISPVFTKVYLNNNGINSVFKYPLRNLTSAESFPFPVRGDSGSIDIKGYWNKFVSSLVVIKNIQSPLALLSKMKDLIFEWCWCIPYSQNNGNEDISIYDHCSATMAMALSLAIAGEIEKPFRIIVGDLSGIQKFIFQSKNQVFHGAARTFRGRSFIISALSTAFKLGLCNKIGIIPFVDLIDAGGRFTFILPNIEGVEDIISAYQEEIEIFLFKKYLGTLCLVMDYSLAVGRDVLEISDNPQNTPFKNLLAETARLLSVQKIRKFSKALAKVGYVFEDEIIEGKRCEACGIRTERDNGLCHECHEQMTFGGKLPNESIISFSLSQKENEIEILPGVKMFLGQGDREDLSFALPFKKKQSTQYPVWRINMHIPNMEFSDIAKKSLQEVKINDEVKLYGNPLLSYIKIDVDNLGEIFINGMGNNAYTLTRYTTLSRMLSQFFSMHIASILDEEQFKYAYTIINGGDDIFIVLPWNKTIPFLLRLKKDFSLFCCDNKKIHFSAGVAIEDSNTPFSKCNRNAEDAEHQAKNHEDKNCVSLWNHVYNFGQLSLLNESINKLLSFCDYTNPVISKSFIYRNLMYMNDWINEKNKGNAKKYEIIPKFKYDLARTYERNKKNEKINEVVYFFMDGFNKSVASPNEIDAEIYRDTLVTVIYERRIFNEIRED